MAERNILLTLAYDGTEFCGWQRQQNVRTVQGELERALATLHPESPNVIAAGRTDSGVHALGQAAGFRPRNSTIPIDRYPAALNRLLPSDLKVRCAREVAPSFHPRFDATRRTYRYQLLVSDQPDPYYERFSYRIHRHPRIAVWNRMAAALIGEQDFTAFAASPQPGESMDRRVYAAGFSVAGPLIVFRICANAFLWRMIRSVVGTILEASADDPNEFVDILRSRDRARAGATAPSRGLCLERVEY